MKTSYRLLSILSMLLFFFSFSCCSDDKEEGGLKIKYLVLSEKELSFDILAAEQIIEVKTNLTGLKVEVSENWCKADLDDKQLKVKVEECSDDIDERKAEIKVEAMGETTTLLVTQSALNDLKLTVASAKAD